VAEAQHELTSVGLLTRKDPCATATDLDLDGEATGINIGVTCGRVGDSLTCWMAGVIGWLQPPLVGGSKSMILTLSKLQTAKLSQTRGGES